ncbi:putative ankyrin repeat protein [Colletotrichum shisoi]|uniref:Putative ankyrin repeat protein n=1 Tax=Colletotrichum shisoi TaxID=2078593 RepID=A0A5Q4BSA1_9PEZI|nr:putative ankyrin repeat protein [Colletotrichum shisoi]
MIRGDAPIVKLCLKGDIGAVRTLIARGEASARDTTPSGGPLLVAAHCGNFELCEYLISEGADIFGDITRPIASPLISYLCSPFRDTCIDLKFIELFDSHLEYIPETADGIPLFLRMFFASVIRETTTSSISDRFCESFCELLRQYRVPLQRILQRSDSSDRFLFSRFYKKCSFGAFQSCLNLNEALLEPMSSGESILHFLAESGWDETELTARLQSLQNRGVDLLSVSGGFPTPLSRAARNPDWLRTWVASLQNCGTSVQQIGFLTQKCICRLLSRVGSQYQKLRPSQEHECGFGSNSILRDAVGIEYLSMEGGAEADDEDQDTNDEDWETECEDGQSDDEDEWEPGEWIYPECLYCRWGLKSEVANPSLHDSDGENAGSIVVSR